LTETSKEALRKFLQRPEIKSWYDGVGTGLKESTRDQYLVFLMRYIGKEDPAGFLKRAQEKPREVAIEIKGKLGEAYKQSMTAAHLMKYALRSFLDFHEVDVPVKAKIKVRRVRKKPELSWEDAEKIIVEADEPYRSLFKFMVWSGLGEDEVMEIQTSPSIQRGMEEQRPNPKSHIRIDLSPRKSTLDEFFTLVPKQYVPNFPLKTRVFKTKTKGEADRGGALIDPHDMQNVWRRAAKKAKIWQEGLGPHTLRSAFRSQCAKLGVAAAVGEFCMGHGGGDKYGYAREVLNEQYVASELRKLWAGQTGISDPLTSGLAKLTATGWKADVLSDEERSRVFQFLTEKVKPKELQRLGRMDVDMKNLTAIQINRYIEKFNPTRTQVEEPRKRPTRRTAHNGGTPINSPYETRIVGEEGLVPLLNEGWEIVKELSNTKIVLRRANAA
jgi:hypothetical protein